MRPNFLFFLPDQHRPDWLPTNPELPLRMPNLARIAERGVRFTRVLCPSPLCAPSRACLASGREYDRCGVANNKDDYPLEQPTYYQSLRDAGYRVAGVGKFDLHKATMDWGLDGSRLLREWGFTEGIDNEGKMDAIASYTGVRGGGARVQDHASAASSPRAAGADHATEGSSSRGPKGPYMAFLESRGLAETHVEDFTGRRGEHGHHLTHATPLPDDAYCDNWIAENGLGFVRGFPQDQPWHLVVNFTGPHSPMDVTESMRERWQGIRFPQPAATGSGGSLDAETHNAVRQNYAAMLENIDSQIGRFLALVEERGELDRTVIVYSSDHGEMLGDHNRWGKSTYHQPAAGVPLIVAGPGIRSGAVSDALVSMHDLTATFLELADVPPLPVMDSRSLVPILTGRAETHRPHVRSGLDRWRLVFDGRYKLVQGAGNTPLLFDLEADPHEIEDVASAHPEVVSRLTPLSAAGA